MKAKTKILINQLNAISKPEHFNSNNDWGFGGAIGEKYNINGNIVKVAKACYRHLPATDFITITNSKGMRIFDELQTTKSIKEAIEIIQSLK